MNIFIRYNKGQGNLALFARIRNVLGQYLNNDGINWSNTEATWTKAFLTEKQDNDPLESLYIGDIHKVANTLIEVVEASTGLVIATESIGAFDNTDVINSIQAISLQLDDIRASINFAPTMTAISNLQTQISELNFTVDLQPVLDSISTLSTSVHTLATSASVAALRSLVDKLTVVADGRVIVGDGIKQQESVTIGDSFKKLTFGDGSKVIVR